MHIKAINEKVLVQRHADPKQIGSIVVPNPEEHAKWSGTVVAADPVTELEVGTVVWFERARMEVEVNGETLTVVRYEDCWGVEVP